jgi:hypothetical protein
LAHATEKLADLTLLLGELQRCGWKPVSAADVSGLDEVHFISGGGGIHAPSRHLKTDRGTSLIVIDFGETRLGGRDALFPRFLDFPMETRMALDVASALTQGVGYLLLLSREEISLIRLPQEALEYRVKSTREFEDELLPALVAKAAARSERQQVVASPMEESRNLLGWLRHWGRQLSAQLDVGAEDCEKFLWKLILMLQAERKTGGQLHHERWGVLHERRDRTWNLSYDSLSTHADFQRLLEDFEHTFSTRIFSGDAEIHGEWLKAIEETSLAEQLRAELLMQSQLRFEAETVAWLYTDVEREQAGWKRDISGLEPLSKRLAVEGWQVLKPLVCDIQLHGVTSALRDADRLAERWADYNAYLLRHERNPDQAQLSQPDLFLGAPRGISPAGELTDGLNFLFAESLRLTGVAPEEEFGIGLVFLLKALTFPAKFDWPFFGIDTIDRLWRAPESS